MNETATAAAASLGALTDWIAPDRTALLLIDMQIDFAAPDGALGVAGVDMRVVAPALAQSERLAEAARAAGATVVFIGLQTDPASDSQAWRTRMLRRGGDPDDESALCRAGDRGAEFYGPAPLASELVVLKSRYSGFFRTELDSALKALGIDTLVVCGVTTECCVDCTVRDAFHLDYQVFLASDACAAYELELHQGALKSLELNCAILVTTDQVVTAWGENATHG